jgi:uncharacterized protein YjbJ (UPF0337 family)
VARCAGHLPSALALDGGDAVLHRDLHEARALTGLDDTLLAVGQDRMSGEDKISNKVDELAGKGKETAGRATDDPGLEAEGKGEQAKSHQAGGREGEGRLQVETRPGERRRRIAVASVCQRKSTRAAPPELSFRV